MSLSGQGWHLVITWLLGTEGWILQQWLLNLQYIIKNEIKRRKKVSLLTHSFQQQCSSSVNWSVNANCTVCCLQVCVYMHTSVLSHGRQIFQHNTSAFSDLPFSCNLWSSYLCNLKGVSSAKVKVAQFCFWKSTLRAWDQSTWNYYCSCLISFWISAVCKMIKLLLPPNKAELIATKPFYKTVS